jgi:predicted alpha/beta-hydrolase family hydrolase
MPPSLTEPFADESLNPPVRGFIHYPAAPSGSGLVLTHGAGGNAQSSLLVALAETFAEAGFAVVRCNLPFRQRKPFGPPGPGDAARDREGLKNAVRAIRQFAQQRIFAGGQSYGGRQASMLCAEEPGLANGLLLLSYPLHPPGKPDQLRTQHLPKLQLPVLFVQGTRDPFGAIPEIEAAMKLIPAKNVLLPVEDAGHDLGFKGKSRPEGLPSRILAEFQALFG